MRSSALTAFALAFALATLAWPAEGGVIRGTLRVPLPTPVRPANSSDEAKITDAVIYVEKVPEKVERKLSGSGIWFFWRPSKPQVASIVQKDRRFYPRVLAVGPNTPVAFRNLDDVYHATFSVSAARRFDLGRKMPGRSDTLMFARPGVINLHCDIHPDMLGYVVVTPNHAFTRPDADGQYRLPKLPAGTYTVHTFHPRRGEIRRTVEMPPRGNVTLDIAF